MTLQVVGKNKIEIDKLFFNFKLQTVHLFINLNVAKSHGFAKIRQLEKQRILYRSEFKPSITLSV